jgi:hypothetical protein
MEQYNEWWVSCEAFSCWVKTRGTKIVDAAPIAKKWKGQKRRNRDLLMNYL